MFKSIGEKMNFRCTKSPKVRDCTGVYLGDDTVMHNNRVNDDLTVASGVHDSICTAKTGHEEFGITKIVHDDSGITKTAPHDFGIAKIAQEDFTSKGVHDDLPALRKIRLTSSTHVVAGISGVTVLALVLLGLLLYFVLPRPEQLTTTTMTPAITNPNSIAAIPGSTSTTPPPPTTASTLPFQACTDLEPGLCSVVHTLGLCATLFGQANCCSTCLVSPACRDSDDHCYKVKVYGLCADVAMKNTCCATCKL